VDNLFLDSTAEVYGLGVADDEAGFFYPTSYALTDENLLDMNNLKQGQIRPGGDGGKSGFLIRKPELADIDVVFSHELPESTTVFSSGFCRPGYVSLV